MSSYFKLELDTQCSDIEIVSPTYISKGHPTEIRIISNEEIIDNHEIYFIDSIGNTHNLTFKREKNSLLGVEDFNEVSIGIGILYARVIDTVGNKSPIRHKPISIIPEAKYLLNISDTSSTIYLGVSTTDVNTEVSNCLIKLNETVSLVDTNEKFAKIDLKEERDN